MTKEINWAAPVVGKIEVGKTYVNRMGQKHTHTGHTYVDGDGRFYQDTNQRHVLDLIAEYTPPAPLKMWMNVCDDAPPRLYSGRLEAKRYASFDTTRIAVPVTITEGH